MKKKLLSAGVLMIIGSQAAAIDWDEIRSNAVTLYSLYPNNLLSISTRGYVDEEPYSLTAGFTIEVTNGVSNGGLIDGAKASGMYLLITGKGPFLLDKGISNVVPDPYLEVFEFDSSGNAMIVHENDNWTEFSLEDPDIVNYMNLRAFGESLHLTEAGIVDFFGTGSYSPYDQIRKSFTARVTPSPTGNPNPGIGQVVVTDVTEYMLEYQISKLVGTWEFEVDWPEGYPNEPVECNSVIRIVDEALTSDAQVLQGIEVLDWAYDIAGNEEITIQNTDLNGGYYYLLLYGYCQPPYNCSNRVIYELGRVPVGATEIEALCNYEWEVTATRID